MQYGSIIEEHRTVRSAVGLFDLSHMGEIQVRGDEAVAFLRYAVVSDPGALEPGQAQYSMLCHEDGGIIDDLIVYRREDGDYLVVCNAANHERGGRAAHQPAARGATSTRRSTIAPTASASSRRRVRTRPPCSPSSPTSTWTPSATTAQRPAPWPASTAWWLAPATPARTASSCSATPAARRSCGRRSRRPASALGSAHAAWGAATRCAWRPACRSTATSWAPTTNPYEANLGRVVKLDKGEFIGRAALQAVQQAGPARKLVGLLMGDNAIARAGYAVRVDGAAVGHVTSGTLSPTLGTDRHGLVPAELAGVGNAFEVVVRERPYRAEQVKLPFYRRPDA